MSGFYHFLSGSLPTTSYLVFVLPDSHPSDLFYTPLFNISLLDTCVFITSLPYVRISHCPPVRQGSCSEPENTNLSQEGGHALSPACFFHVKMNVGSILPKFLIFREKLEIWIFLRLPSFKCWHLIQKVKKKTFNIVQAPQKCLCRIVFWTK